MPGRHTPLATAVLFALATAAAAQDAIPRVEAGPDVSFFQVKYWPTDTGAGGHVTVNLTRSIAVETRMHFFPADVAPGQTRGGRTFQFFAGARAAFVSRGRFTVYGIVQPGIVHFTNRVRTIKGDIGDSTHLALDMGADVGIRLSPRWDAHVGWTGPLYGVRGSSTKPDVAPAPGQPVLVAVMPSSLESTFQAHAGVSYRAGSFRPAAETTGRGSWLAGGDFGFAIFPSVEITPTTLTTARVGVFTSFPITTWMDVDGGANVFLRTERGHGSNEGGRVSQALVGVKLGRRVGTLGYFGKIRAGVQSHSEALKEAPEFTHPVFGRIFRPALEIGAVIESALNRRLVWRVDIGDVITFYPARTLLIQGVPFRNLSQPATDTVTITSGLAWRFGKG